MKERIKKIVTFLMCCAVIFSTFSVISFSANNIEGDEIKNETMLIIPMVTMIKDNAGLLFTTLLIGFVLGVVVTLVVQHVRRKGNNK